MLNILEGVALSYLAGSGTATNAAVVGRGLVAQDTGPGRRRPGPLPEED
jgi:hypothetical protein